ncbi:hypothetical protein F2Q70_00017051 [Brassica cretica]|uniref:CCHC-type domain-containing protein n=1 Tax=Brassica cretica TaxID=69181 RepID=A0A8S9I0T9_BRACR|nr:hypothetical protein F2Q70_00017051 [Brassica cretica]
MVTEDQTWTVVRERHREDSSHGKMCGEWVFIDKCEGTRKSKSRKGKEAAGASGPVGIDGTNPTQVLPTQTGLVNNETGEPLVPILPTEVQVDNLGEQHELEREEEAESSHAGDQAGRGTGKEELAEPSMCEVNSSVGQVTSSQAMAQATRRAAGTAAGVAQTTTAQRDTAEEGRTSSGRPECSKCGRRHGGECWKAMGACTRCGKMDHSARDCPGPEQSCRKGSSDGDTRGCHYCGKVGHFKRECPKLQAEQEKSRGEASKPSQSWGQTSTPRVYELSKDEDETKPLKAITELHRRVICLAMDGDFPTVRLRPSFDTRFSIELAFQCHRFEVNQLPVADVMPLLLKSSQSASREEAIEEMKDCRSMLQHWCRSTVMPEYELSIFYDR